MADHDLQGGIKGRVALTRMGGKDLFAHTGNNFLDAAISAPFQLAFGFPRYQPVFVGFVLSMVFAHAPIILPAVARVEVPFHPALYAPLALLHVGLLVRLAGDASGVFALRRAGGLMNALSLAALALAVLWSRARRPAR